MSSAAGPAGPSGAQIPPPRVQEVSAGIFAYIQLDGSWFLNNAGCVVGRESAIVIDTTGTEARARAFHAAVRGVTPLPVNALINTHSHGDHTHGNFMFSPQAAIIGHERCRREILASGNAAQALFPMVDFGDCPVTPPTVTFTDRLDVWVDDLKVELIFVGPAHTTNDIVAWIPERKLLFTGDTIFNGGTPFALGGSVGGWLDALGRLEALGAETIVPGHGEVCGPEVIADVRAYLAFVLDAAREGMAAVVEPLELARELDLGPFAELHDRERLVPNLHRAYAELRGERRGAPLDGVRMFAEMLAFNGGQPLRCLA
ncbi:MAG: MBL fold metallo-hydrolase [Tepidiformaceae bacterium]